MKKAVSPELLASLRVATEEPRQAVEAPPPVPADILDTPVEPAADEEPPHPAQPAPRPSRSKAAPAKGPQSSRVGLVPVTVYVPPEVRRVIRQIAADEDRKIEGLVSEALNLLFADRKKKIRAPIRDRTAG